LGNQRNISGRINRQGKLLNVNMDKGIISVSAGRVLTKTQYRTFLEKKMEQLLLSISVKSPT
jgi:hypothetical protein